MKRLLPILAFLMLWSQSAFAQNAFDHACKGTWASGTTMTAACTYPAGYLAAVGIFIESNNAVQKFSSLTDDCTSHFTQIDAFTGTDAGGSTVDALTYYAKNTTAQTCTITVNLVDSGIVQATIGILVYSGADTTAPLDQHATFKQQDNPGTTANVITSFTVTTTANGEILAGFAFSSRGGVVNYTAGTTGGGYTTRDTYATSMGIGEDQIETTAGTVHFATATQDYSDAVTSNFTAIATFKAAGGGGGGGTPRSLTGPGGLVGPGGLIGARSGQ